MVLMVYVLGTCVSHVMCVCVGSCKEQKLQVGECAWEAELEGRCLVPEPLGCMACCRRLGSVLCASESKLLRADYNTAAAAAAGAVLWTPPHPSQPFTRASHRGLLSPSCRTCGPRWRTRG